MILRISLIYTLHLSLSVSSIVDPKETDCLTGYMTDLQSWVSRDGILIVNDTAAVDFSNVLDIAFVLGEHAPFSRQLNQVDKIKYLSVAKCQLVEIPSIFSFCGNLRTAISDSIEYVTFYGNHFGRTQQIGGYESSINATNAKQVAVVTSKSRISVWSVGLQNVTFKRLRQLDLRACKIDSIDSFTFANMPLLTHLYLGENALTLISSHAFMGLKSLIHLDLSRNSHFDESNTPIYLTIESMETFAHLNLTSLDLSLTPLNARYSSFLNNLGDNLQILSICYAAVFQLRSDAFGKSPLKYLDISGNNDILIDSFSMRGLQSTLRVLYAHSIALKSLNVFKDFKKLEILKVSNNEIQDFSKSTTQTLKNLQILDVSNNRITNWFVPIFETMPQLKLLSLDQNNLNLVSEMMIEDMRNIDYISLSRNSIVCQCILREVYDIAFQNELTKKQSTLKPIKRSESLFHKGFLEYNGLINNRRNLTSKCIKNNDENAQLLCLMKSSINRTANFLFLDYDEDYYACLSLKTGLKVVLNKVTKCSNDMTGVPEEYQVATRSNLMLLLILLVIIPIFAFVYMFRRNFKYFLITLRNSAMLSLISDKGVNNDDDKIFSYDVFVSYCNEDRGWVLDHLLPHVEIDCNISMCLHERDFQVGLSILENIVSCMDRSRAIMLIISKRFLISQWCQFEMHLAQHRLLETRREDLILILLEEIPRRLRPNTLHYLMLTKTYIVWPKEESEKKEFWKRMKKSLVTHKLKSIENYSLA